MTSMDVVQSSSLGNGGAEAPTPASGPIFGEWRLSWTEIQAQLPPTEAEAWQRFVTGRDGLAPEIGQQVADLVQAWAQGHGATHYAHWFQPLTGSAAEKHDGFLTLTVGADQVCQPLTTLPWSALRQGETDASSFPSGGLRPTHTARGYTVWDPTSPLFIRARGGARTLCIPCVFVGYDGQAQDYKTPLLRALGQLSREASRFLNLMSGSAAINEVVATLGTEQEYFLIDRRLYEERADLVLTGRTLLGAAPTRGQQFDDHYCRVMPERVQAFQVELEQELFRIGVPVKTRHGEVAPGQYELAPVYEPVNIAVDHNLMTMELLAAVAERHGFVCLLHERPFAGFNGSGKHNNWSLLTDTGLNLLDPGTTPDDHQRFLAILAVVLLALHRHGGMLRTAVATAGNDLRLGGHEAPPPIVSAYLGSAIDALVDATLAGEPAVLALSQGRPITDQLSIRRDATDRNRTAAFAFTGNKFEFRAVGAADHCAWPMTVLNAAVAEAFGELSTRLESRMKHQSRQMALNGLIRDVLAEVRGICFDGDGYTAEWRAEAARRGLPVLPDTPAALGLLLDAATTRFLTKSAVLSETDVQARYTVFAERYLNTLTMEARTLVELATTSVLPAIEEQLAYTSNAFSAAQQAGGSSRLAARVQALVGLVDRLTGAAERVDKALSDGLPTADLGRRMVTIRQTLKPALDELRQACDDAERLVADHLWPMPKYRHLLFS